MSIEVRLQHRKTSIKSNKCKKECGGIRRKGTNSWKGRSRWKVAQAYKVSLKRPGKCCKRSLAKWRAFLLEALVGSRYIW